MQDVTLSERLERTFRDHPDALDHRAAMAALLDVYALHLAPLEELDGAEHWQHHPRIAALKGRLEARCAPGSTTVHRRPTATRSRRCAGSRTTRWCRPSTSGSRSRHTREELVDFISHEGGPDADFDDLVAICQVGLQGLPKLTLGANYWDEMGRGELPAVHTELHHRMADALGVRSMPVDELPMAALERKALNGYLATNRALQPEMMGSLGMIECQAGPRCRRVVAAMRRLDVPDGALPFYEEHAAADPQHGKDWLEDAVTPLVASTPDWGPRIVTGAAWRATVNRRFFPAMEERFGWCSAWHDRHTCEFGPLTVEYDDQVLAPRPWTLLQSARAADELAPCAGGPDGRAALRGGPHRPGDRGAVPDAT